MANGVPSDRVPRYDRDFLLSPAKRNQIIELWEVEKFGRDSFGNPNAVSLYGMRPADWHARGVRILARTTLEAVRDPLGDRIGQDVARAATLRQVPPSASSTRSPAPAMPFIRSFATCRAQRGSALSSSNPSSR